jgi:hypothetical protein
MSRRSVVAKSIVVREGEEKGSGDWVPGAGIGFKCNYLICEMEYWMMVAILN